MHFVSYKMCTYVQSVWKANISTEKTILLLLKNLKLSKLFHITHYWQLNVIDISIRWIWFYSKIFFQKCFNQMVWELYSQIFWKWNIYWQMISIIKTKATIYCWKKLFRTPIFINFRFKNFRKTWLYINNKNKIFKM